MNRPNTSSDLSTPPTLSHRSLLLGGLVLLLPFVLVAPVSAQETPRATQSLGSETLEQVGGSPQATKATTYVCNPQGNHCFGRWADMIDHLFTNGDGSTQIYVTPDFEFELNERGFCTLNGGKFIKLLDYGGGERVVLDQLYLSYATNSQFTLRLGSEASTGECYIHYVRTLFNEP